MTSASNGRAPKSLSKGVSRTDIFGTILVLVGLAGIAGVMFTPYHWTSFTVALIAGLTLLVLRDSPAKDPQP